MKWRILCSAVGLVKYMLRTTGNHVPTFDIFNVHKGLPIATENATVVVGASNLL